MADEKKTERERVVAFLRAQARDALHRAAGWDARGMDSMRDKKEWESDCASQWANAIAEGAHDDA
jgi:hypothetical protein